MVPNNDAESATAVDVDIASMLDVMQQTWSLPNIRELFLEPLLPPQREEEPENWPHDVVIHLHELAQLNVDVDTVRQQLREAVTERRKGRKAGPLAARFVIAADVQAVLREYENPNDDNEISCDEAGDSETDELNDLDTRTRTFAAGSKRSRKPQDIRRSALGVGAQPYISDITEEDRALIPSRIHVGHVGGDISIMTFGSLPDIPENLSLDELLELNAIQIKMLAAQEERFMAKARMSSQRSRIEMANQERAVFREACLQLRFRRKLLEFRKARLEGVALTGSPLVEDEEFADP